MTKTPMEMFSELSPEDRAVYGAARVRNAAFHAVQTLWRRRKAEGVTLLQVAQKIGMPPARLSEYLKGPGNWTFRTFGELVEGLDGEAEILAHALGEDPPPA